MRLQFLGHFVSAASVRTAMAQNRCKELRGIPLESALWLKHLLGAHAYLEEDQALASAAARPRLDTIDPLLSTQAQKLRADGSSKAKVEVIVFDETGLGLSGQEVRLAANGAGLGLACAARGHRGAAAQEVAAGQLAQHGPAEEGRVLRHVALRSEWCPHRSPMPVPRHPDPRD